MARYVVIGIAALCLAACSTEPGQDVDEQPIMTQQGTELQGLLLLGTQLQGMTIQGFRFSGATRNGAPLVNFRLDKGELIAEQNGVTLRNTQLVNTRLFGYAHNRNLHPPQDVAIEYQISAIEAESPAYDPTHTGATFLYSLLQNVDNTGSWQPACPVDGDGRRAAIAVSGTWDDSAARVPVPTRFTFGCTTGAVAKCYRWGYRPWVTGFGDLTRMHWVCTRVARADYCGDGQTHTHENVLINAWDNLSPPGPILARGATPSGMTFEAAWDQNGALCLSHERWSLPDGSEIAAECPNRLRPPGGSMQPGTVCDNISEALMQGMGNGPRMFDESDLSPSRHPPHPNPDS